MKPLLPTEIMDKVMSFIQVKVQDIVWYKNPRKCFATGNWQGQTYGDNSRVVIAYLKSFLNPTLYIQLLRESSGFRCPSRRESDLYKVEALRVIASKEGMQWFAEENQATLTWGQWDGNKLKMMNIATKRIFDEWFQLEVKDEASEMLLCRLILRQEHTS